LKHYFTDKHKKALSILSIVVFLLFTAIVSYFIGVPMLKLVESPDVFRNWVDSFGVFSRVIFVGMVFLQVIVALIPGEPLEIAAGYAFGALEGTILCLIGMFLGSLVVFYCVRKFGIKLVSVFFSEDKLDKLKFLKNSKKRELLIFIVFMIPGTPKDLLSYFVGLTDIRFSVWALISIFARIPSVVTSTIGGGALGEESYIFAAIAFTITLIISLIGFLVYNKICKISNK